MQTFTQSTFLQNLGGKDSIVGRSIQVFVDDTSVGCCVIGLDAPPAPVAQTYTPHYHPAQHYGYGGYRGYGGY